MAEFIFRITDRPFSHLAPPFFPVPALGFGQDADDFEAKWSDYKPTEFSPCEFETDRGDIFQLNPEPLVTYSVKHIIVETQMAGNTNLGTVKEEVGTEDVKILISGQCVSKDKREYPSTDVNKMLEIFKQVPRRMKFRHKNLSKRFGFEYVIVKSLKLMPKAGFQSVQPYKIELVSDYDFELIIE